MDTLPAYACRVRGDAPSWRKVLSMAGYGNGGVPPRVLARMDEAATSEAFGPPAVSEATWQAYASGRPHVAVSAAAEAAATLLRKREAVLTDAARKAGLGDREELDSALRTLVGLLAGEGGEEEGRVARQIPGVGRLAAFLCQRMCVPRDMGAPAAAELRRLADALATRAAG
jgi:glutathione S-transferase